MKRAFALIGWCVAVAATGLWLSEFKVNRSLRTEFDLLSAQHAESLDRIGTQEEKLTMLSTNVTDVTGQLDQAQLSMSILEDLLEAFPDRSLEIESTLSAEEPLSVFEEVETETEADEKIKNPFEAIFSGGMSEEVIRASVKMNVHTQYGQFLATLAPEKAEQARLAITDILLDQSELGMAALSGESSADDYDFTDYEQWMLDELSLFLSEEEMDAFEEYQDTMPERLLEQSYSMQLAMYAPGLSEENRAIVLDVLIEEMLYAPEGVDPMSFSPGAPFDVMIEAYDRARERLDGVFSEDQQAIANQFFEYQMSVYEMMLPMMESLQESLESTP